MLLAAFACVPTMYASRVLAQAGNAQPAQLDETFSFYFPTPDATVQRMLEMARVTDKDFLIDLGSGDGRIVMAAAQRYGTHGLGVDIDPALVEKSIAEAKRRTLADKVRFEQGDALKADIRRATVITLFLMPNLMARLQPRFLAELRPGTRIVSHEFSLFDWPADETLTLYAPTRGAGSGGDSIVKLWIVPANFSGEWAVRAQGAAGLPFDVFELTISQRYQRATGAVRHGGALHPLTNVLVRGADLFFTAAIGANEWDFSAQLSGDTMAGELRVRQAGQDQRASWSAHRSGGMQRLDRPDRTG